MYLIYNKQAALLLITLCWAILEKTVGKDIGTRPVQTNNKGSISWGGESLSLVASAREDICKVHCNCTKRNNFQLISCDFRKNRYLSEIFGKNFQVPADATSVTIHLAVRTNFRLEAGFFSESRVNSLRIEGTNSDDQVEITSEAFSGNDGPYPDIQINNVQTVFVRKQAFLACTSKFTVRNSNEVILYADAFEEAEVNGLFVDIKDLRIDEGAFNLAKAKLRIEKSNIDNLYRFGAFLNEICFTNSNITTINNGTFDVFNINAIIFEGCRIDAIKSRAITERLFSKHVSITDAVIGFIESEAIYGTGISELIINNNSIDTIYENAIQVAAINATITNNTVKHLSNNWLRVKEWSKIIIEKNKFGEFGMINLEPTKQPAACRFNGNSLTQPLPGSLNMNSNCIIHEVSVNIACRCNPTWLHELTAHDLYSEMYCTIDKKLGLCFNRTTLNLQKYLHEVCDDTKNTLDCGANRNLTRVNDKFFTPEELQQKDSNFPTFLSIFGGILVLFAVVLAVLLIVICVKKKDACRSTNTSLIPYANEHVHEFSNEDRVIIDRTMQLLQKKYPQIYKQVKENTQEILRSDLPHRKCVKAISQIVNLLNEVRNADKDLLIVDFNNLLTQHLQPPQPTAPPVDPVYTEPSLTGNDGGFYTSSTIVPVEGYALRNEICGEPVPLPEHIYAEPNCVEQPLLRNEYASPSDHHQNMEGMDLYSDPYNGRDITKAAPYAVSVAAPPHRSPQYATPMRNQKLPNLPSISKRTQNLPDVLYQSHNNNNNNTSATITPQTENNHQSHKPLTNVQKLAQDLQNKVPNLNPANHQHQQRNMHLFTPAVYTAPDVSHKQIRVPRLASPETDECEMDMRGATGLPPETSSNHSGGSNETVEIDEVIEYADA
ncbi:uncharacterized protein LOC119671986 [Teleopsis dalmanni]|uniref:uncharacterized protein LOC119671986 n=1 Tax=Teleopsis dalmanni TaxID=139649 RepID=UPI0018CCEE7E|nr:uncharacterized protein LOC119671986 [Teleopsis dalmanni]